MSDPTRTPVLELADALRAKELSATELLDASLAEVDRLNDELNAVVWRDDDVARAKELESAPKGDPGRRTGDDHVARLEHHELAEVPDEVPPGEDHVLGVAVLTQLAIHPKS